MADFDIIEDVSKTIPKGKDLKKLTPFIIGGLVLGVVALLFRPKPQNENIPMSETDGIGDTPDLGGIMSDFANQTNQSIRQNNEEMGYQLSEVAGNLFDVIGEQNQVINQLQKDLENQIRNINNRPTPTPTTTPTYQQTNLIQESLLQPIFESSGSSIYFDGIDDDTQFSNIRSNISRNVESGRITQSQARQEKQRVAGLGNDGEGWTAENQTKSEERMRNDPSIKQSEIERTNLVIQNRRNAGLSTDRQIRYLQTLIK